jgi:anti-sigma factor RsiW
VTQDAEQLSCQELVELVTDYLEGALTPDDRARFEAHVRGCDGCRAYLEQMQETIRLLGRLPRETITAEAGRRLLAAFGDWKAGGAAR